MTMIEQIARASFACWRKRMDELGHHLTRNRKFEDMTEDEHEFAFMNASAMLEAIRELTPAMLVACDEAKVSASGDALGIRVYWPIAIDAALAEKPE